MTYNAVIDWLAPLAAIAGVAFAVRWAMKKKASPDVPNFLKTIENNVVENYVLYLLASLIVLPLLLQVLYSIPLCAPRVDSGDVLAFWGVVLGIVGAAFSYQRQKMLEAENRIWQLAPKLQIEMAHHKEGEPYHLKVINGSQFTYLLTSVCDLKQTQSLSGLSSITLDIDKSRFDAFNEKFLKSLSSRGLDTSSVSSCISIELYDPDGVFWMLDFKNSSPGKWHETCKTFRTTNVGAR